jgi:K+-sensing histidine kinase KdpD
LAVAKAEAHTSPGVSTSVLVVAFPGGSGTASLVREARRLASRSPVPIAVVEVSPSAGLWVCPLPSQR